MRHRRTTVAERSASPRNRRGGRPLVLVGIVVLIALVAAYLSDCLPGLGSGGKLGTPSSEAPTASSSSSQAPVAGEAGGDRLGIVVEGEQCRQGQAAAVPCAELCASLDRTRAATVEIAVDATRGRHGTVEELRKCLRDAGFAHVRIHSE
jgi:hypothetical protein